MEQWVGCLVPSRTIAYTTCSFVFGMVMQSVLLEHPIPWLRIAFLSDTRNGSFPTIDMLA